MANTMKFSKDTSRLVEGRWYWCSTSPRDVHIRAWGAPDNGKGYLWGDEVVPPTVEVEPERQALLPCPFCGGASLHMSDIADTPGGHYWVVCETCEADGPVCQGHAASIAAWNTRANPAPAPAPAEPSTPAWVPPVCPAGQFRLYSGGVCVAQHDEVLDAHQYPKPSWPPRIGEIVEVLFGTQWIASMATSAPWKDVLEAEEYVECGRWSISKSNEGKTWRWVYRDLSDYTPPGGV